MPAESREHKGLKRQRKSVVHYRPECDSPPPSGESSSSSTSHGSANWLGQQAAQVTPSSNAGSSQTTGGTPNGTTPQSPQADHDARWRMNLTPNSRGEYEFEVAARNAKEKTNEKEKQGESTSVLGNRSNPVSPPGGGAASAVLLREPRLAEGLPVRGKVGVRG